MKQQQEILMRSGGSEFEWADDRVRELRRLWLRISAKSAGGWASRRMPSSERLTVLTCRHAHRRSEPVARHVHRACRAGSPSRRSRIPCLSRACGTPTFPRQLSAPLRRSNRHDMRRLHHGASVRRAAGRSGSQARRRSTSVMNRRRSMCRTATSTHVSPTSLVAGETRRTRCFSLNFNEHAGAHRQDRMRDH